MNKKEVEFYKKYQKVDRMLKKEATRLVKRRLNVGRKEIVQIRDLDFSKVDEMGNGDVMVVYFHLCEQCGRGFMGLMDIPFEYFFLTNKEIDARE